MKLCVSCYKEKYEEDIGKPELTLKEDQMREYRVKNRQVSGDGTRSGSQRLV